MCTWYFRTKFSVSNLWRKRKIMKVSKEWKYLKMKEESSSMFRKFEKLQCCYPLFQKQKNIHFFVSLHVTYILLSYDWRINLFFDNTNTNSFEYNISKIKLQFFAYLICLNVIFLVSNFNFSSLSLFILQFWSFSQCMKLI